ncbi:MAG: DUF2179 domain-containing protein [Chloroflexi bacterium]|nr:DUF2179 domain-containing protein [Chloroflexota bacterium]
MNPLFNIEPEVYAGVILPVIIFFARIVDVSLGTLRIAFIARGHRYLAPLVGFFEVFIWIVVIGQIVQNLHSLVSYLAYAAGFASGSYVGLLLEAKFAIGTLIVRVITPTDAGVLIEQLHAAGYGVTSLDAHGSTGDMTLIFTVVRRRALPDVINLINEVTPKAFVTVEEVRSFQEGIFPARAHSFPGPLARRKAK